MKGRNGRPDRIELLVRIDLVTNPDSLDINSFIKDEYQLKKEEVADYKEVFLLFDRDQDGILSFPQFCLAIKTLGIRMTGFRPMISIIGYTL